MSSEHAAAASRPGLFLAIEGVEGSGKTTQAARLAESLRARGFEVVAAREPGSTPLGERIRETTLGDLALAVPPRSELFLMLAARAAFVEQVVRPALEEGKIVLADRFELSTLAYQGAGRGLPLEEVRRCNDFATGGLRPDLTVLLDVAAAEGARRQREAGKALDRLEREAADFHERVARGYVELAARVPHVVRVDGRGSVEAVQQRIVDAIVAYFPETFVRSGFITAQRAGGTDRGPGPSSSSAGSGIE